jgi:type II secretory pathway component PulJ
MNLKIFLIALLLVSIFGVAGCPLGRVSAQTMTEAQRQVLIAQIKQAIIQLQIQLNQLIERQKNCTPNWQCGEWNLCLNGQQTKICTDSNDCGKDTG